MEDFLSHGGVSFTSAEEEKIVRTLTDFNRVYATDLHINRFSDKGLTGYIAGKASRKRNNDDDDDDNDDDNDNDNDDDNDDNDDVHGSV